VFLFVYRQQEKARYKATVAGLEASIQDLLRARLATLMKAGVKAEPTPSERLWAAYLRIKFFFEQYGRALVEAVDFSKDIYYC